MTARPSAPTHHHHTHTRTHIHAQTRAEPASCVSCTGRRRGACGGAAGCDGWAASRGPGAGPDLRRLHRPVGFKTRNLGHTFLRNAALSDVCPVVASHGQADRCAPVASGAGGWGGHPRRPRRRSVGPTPTLHVTYPIFPTIHRAPTAAPAHNSKSRFTKRCIMSACHVCDVWVGSAAGEFGSMGEAVGAMAAVGGRPVMPDPTKRLQYDGVRPCAPPLRSAQQSEPSSAWTPFDSHMSVRLI